MEEGSFWLFSFGRQRCQMLVVMPDVADDDAVCVCAGMIERGLPDSSLYHPKSSQSESGDNIKSSDLTENTEVFITEPTANQSEGSTGAKLNPSSPDWLDNEWENLDPSVLEEGDGGRSAQTQSIESESNTPITVQPKAAPTQTAPHTHSEAHTPSTHPHTPLLEEDRCGLPLAIFTKVHTCTML